MSLSILKNGDTINASSGSIFMSNSAGAAADNVVTLPNTGIYPGWSCDIILETPANGITVSAGSMTVNSAASKASTGAMVTVTCISSTAFVAQQTSTGGAVTAL